MGDSEEEKVGLLGCEIYLEGLYDKNKMVDKNFFSFTEEIYQKRRGNWNEGEEKKWKKVSQF